MSRFDADRLDDITAAIEAIRTHVERGPMTDGLVTDAIRIRLLEIGEAVKSLSSDVTATEPEVPWRQIARMRDHLAHRYFMTDTAIIRDTVDNDLDPLAAAIERMRGRESADRTTDT
ncbi:MAG: HepT-like ribonuclease domain-containing protein [Dermatophilaceae bacterium]